MEMEIGFEFLYQALVGDAQIVADVGAGQVYEDEAPAEAVYPFIVIGMGESGQDAVGANNQRCMVVCSALVRVVGLGNDMVRLKRVCARVDAVLHGASGMMGGHMVMTTRERPFRSSGWVGNVLYKNLGGFYRVEIG